MILDKNLQFAALNAMVYICLCVCVCVYVIALRQTGGVLARWQYRVSRSRVCWRVLSVCWSDARLPPPALGASGSEEGLVAIRVSSSCSRSHLSGIGFPSLSLPFIAEITDCRSLTFIWLACTLRHHSGCLFSPLHQSWDVSCAMVENIMSLLSSCPHKQ